MKSPRFWPLPIAVPCDTSPNVKLSGPAPTAPEIEALSAPLLLSVPLLRVNVNVSVSIASKPRKVAVSVPAVVLIMASSRPPTTGPSVPAIPFGL